MIDLDIELPVRTTACTRAEPVTQIISAGSIGLWKVAHHLLCNRIDQIAGSLVDWAWALISGQVIVRDILAAQDAASIAVKDPGVRIPDLAGSFAAQPIAVEGPSLRSAQFAKIAGAHGITGNACGSC